MKVGDLVTFKNDRTVIGSIVKIGKRQEYTIKKPGPRYWRPVWVMWGFLDGGIEQEPARTLEVVDVK